MRTLWRLALALLLAVAVLSQTTINAPQGMSTGNTKCSFSKNITLSDSVTGTTLTITSQTSGFNGFVSLDGTPGNSTVLSLTKNYTSISICSYSSTSAGTYQFEITTSNSTVYGARFSLTIKEMKSLNFTGTVSVPKSSCSTLQYANLSDVVTALNVTVGLTGTPFYLTGQNGNNIGFDTTRNQSFQICSYDNGTIGQLVPVSLTLSNSSSTEVYINLNQLAITIVDYPTPSIKVNTTVVPDSIAQQYLNYTVTSNMNGYFLYYVQELSSLATPTVLTLVQVSTALTTGQTSIQSQSDYLTYLYNSPRNLVVGNLSVNALTQSTLQLKNYFPNTVYSVSGYFQTPSKGLSATVSYKNITTPTQTDQIYTVTATFGAEPLYNDRQAVLCYIQNQLSANSTAFMTNSYGQRCSSAISSNTPLFKYTGSQYDEIQDIYYLVTNDISTATNSSITTFKGLFTTGEITATAKTAINSQTPTADLTFFILNATTSYSGILADTAWGAPTLGITMANSNTIDISFTDNTFFGSVYLGIYPTITTSATVPTAENITNCKLGSGSTALQYCQRILLLGQKNVSITVDGLDSTFTYQVFLTATNRFPYRPYPIQTVVKSNFTTTATGNITFSNNNPIVEAGTTLTSISATISSIPDTSTNATVSLPAATWAISDTVLNSANSRTITFPNTIGSLKTNAIKIFAPAGAVGSYLIPVVSDNPLYYLAKGYLNVTVTKPVTLGSTTVTSVAGGCSQLISAKLPFNPTSNATLSVKYSNGSIVPTSPSTVFFTNSDLSKSFMVCPSASTAVSSLTLTVDVSSLENLYVVANKPTITLTITKIPNGTVTLSATSLTMQKGGCSSTNVIITLKPLPTSDLVVTFDEATLVSKNLYVFVVPTSSKGNQITYNNIGNSSQTIKICSYENATVSTVQVPVSLSGGDDASYYISGSAYSVSVTINNPSLPPILTITAPSYYDGGTGKFSVMSPLNGNYYFSIREGNFTSDPYTLNQYLALINSSNDIIQNQSEFLTRLYAVPRDFSVSQTSLVPQTANEVTVTDFYPDTNYTFCSYYQNVAGTYSSPSLGCKIYLTPSNDTYVRHMMVLTFSSPLSDTERNSLLCYITTTAVADPTKILNRAGESCNSTAGASPQRMYYNYTRTTEFKSKETIFLTVPDNSSSSETSVQNFKGLFINNLLTPTATNYINQTVSNKLLTGLYSGKIGFSASRSATRTLVVAAPLFNQIGGYINVTNVTLSLPGQIFFGVGNLNSTTPSQEQLMNCQDGANITLLNCTRLIVPTGNTTYWHQIYVQNSAGTSQYYLFYMPTNDFLERPVPVASVANLSVSNISYTITLPALINFVKEGCSSLQTATITPMTPSSVYVRVGTGSLGTYGMFLRDQTDNSILFPASSTSANFYLCSNVNAANSSIPIDVVGNTSVQYITNVSTISVTLTTPTTLVPPVIYKPSFSGQTATSNLTNVRSGTFYWTFQEGNYSTAAMNLTDIQSELSGTTSKIIRSQNDYLGYLYDGPRDLRIGSTASNAGQNASLVFPNLLPNTTYTLCSYFVTNGNTSVFSTANCSNMTSPNDTWTIYKTLLTFSANQTSEQRNNLLCKFIDLLGSSNTDNYKYIINQQSESCNRTTTAPNASWYYYSGSTYDNASQVIYLVVVDNSTTSQQQVSSFKALFDSTTGHLANINTLSASVNNTLIKGSYLGNSSYSPYRDQSRDVSNSNITYNNTKQQITVQNITINATAAIYFVVQSNTTANPSVEQVLNCRDGSGSAAIQCFRFVGTTGSTNNQIKLTQVTADKNYSVAIVVVNEYPFRPKTVSGVFSSSDLIVGGLRMVVAFFTLLLLLAVIAP